MKIFKKDPKLFLDWIEYQKSRPRPLPNLSGRGIIIPAGGKYTLNAMLNIQILREIGCKLPIEVWYLGENEEHDFLFEKLKALDCTMIDALEFQEEHEILHPSLHGWELKSFACKWSKFAEVIVMDADVLPVKPLEYIFECDAYKETGLLFLRDQYFHHEDSVHWEIIGQEPRRECQVESGVFVVDKVRNWDWVCLHCKLNEHGSIGLWDMLKIYGDKDTLAIAAYLLDKPFTWSIKPMDLNILHTMSQYDWSCHESPTFYHRVARKIYWTGNPYIEGFPFEDMLHAEIDKLKSEIIPKGIPYCANAEYHIVKDAKTVDMKRITMQNGEIDGAGRSEKMYSVVGNELKIFDETAKLTATLMRTKKGWLGSWDVEPFYTVMILI